ncbi:cytochrome P450 [Streptomyces sp. NPDC091268]|uniref:cytochrome P450 n=1 Tax=Streptomyces sp. NPDC091268 TaxID=3365979 RepID=UPI003804CD63
MDALRACWLAPVLRRQATRLEMMMDESKRRVSDIPDAPGALPLLGHAVRVMRDPFGFLASLSTHGDLVRVRMGPRWTMVAVCCPKLSRETLVSAGLVERSSRFWGGMREAFGNGLVTCPHREHRRQRRLCQPSFHPQRLQGYGQVIAADAQRAAARWPAGRAISLTEEIGTLVVQSTVRCMFAGGLTGAGRDRFLKDLKILEASGIWLALTPGTRLPLPGPVRFRRASGRLRRMALEVIATRRAEGRDHGDLLSALIAAVDDESAGAERLLSDEELVDQVITFFVAATATTSAATTWALSLLARHPDVQEQIAAEVRDVAAGRPLTGDDVPRLDAVNRVVAESLRLNPPLWVSPQTLSRDTVLADAFLPAGTEILLSPYLLSRHPDLYKDPELFDPDRWRDGRPELAGHLPFGGGSRKCIGDRFAILQATLVVASVLTHWRLSPVNEPTWSRFRAVLRPRQMRLLLEARDSAPPPEWVQTCTTGRAAAGPLDPREV